MLERKTILFFVTIPNFKNFPMISGHFSELFISFKLKRHMGYFMINFYVPCSLLVIISFVGFWINREATADRISLGKH